MEYFDERAKKLRPFLQAQLSLAREEFSFIKPWGQEVPERLTSFVLGGKLIRGGLVALGQELAGGKPGQEAVAVGAAMELLQSAFLIHDDIMDRDKLRRGRPSIFWQYQEDATARGLADAYHYGESMGICAGDCAFFLAFRLLSGPALPSKLAVYCGKELYAVGLAQMQDVSLGMFSDLPEEEEIYNLYTWKTGRYSFSLPLASGAMLSGAGKELITALEKLGEYMGVAFQLRDDELGIFGLETKLGKPIGSDIREGKKTLLISLASPRMSTASQARLSRILGKREANQTEINEFRGLLEESGVREEITARMEILTARSMRMIDSLEVPHNAKAILTELLTFISTRSA